MNKHEIKTCPRCNANFECRSGDVLKCECYGVPLTPEETAYIERHFDECLCKHCIVQLKQKAANNNTPD